MPSNLKKLVRARMEQTGESWQTALRQVRAQSQTSQKGAPDMLANEQMPTAAIPPRDVVAELLVELQTPSVFRVLVGRMPAVAGGPDYAEVLRRSRDLLENPRWYADTGGVEMLISREQHDALIAAGAADDRLFQILRSNVPTDFPRHTFSDKCENCHRWIWMGAGEHEGQCVCGQRYRVAFDLLEGLQWGKPQGMLCADCGADAGMTEVSKGDSPWHNLNEWQVQCNACKKKSDDDYFWDFDVIVSHLLPGQHPPHRDRRPAHGLRSPGLQIEISFMPWIGSWPGVEVERTYTGADWKEALLKLTTALRFDRTEVYEIIAHAERERTVGGGLHFPKMRPTA